MALPVAEDKDKQKIIAELIIEGALFLYGNGWCLSEVMEYYKDQSVNFGNYNVIFWTDKDTYRIEAR